MPDLVTPRIADYELLRPIGRGSFGEVWLARAVTGVLRAIKIVARDRFPTADPFDREWRGLKEFAAASSGETSQLALLHVGRDDAAGHFYCVMTLADDAERGRDIDPNTYVPLTLAELRTRRGAIGAEETLRIGVELARGLAGLHQRGLVHRDVKPSNVVLVGGHPKLTDFGLVARATDAGTLIGTTGFVPPEGPGSPAADVFALGKVLYQLATGLAPEEFPQLPLQVAARPDADAFMRLNEVVLQACEPRLADRYADGAALLAGLEAAQRTAGATALPRARRAGELTTYRVLGFASQRNHAQGDGAGLRRFLRNLQEDRAVEWLALSASSAADQIFAREAIAAGLGWEVVLPVGSAPGTASDTTPELAALLLQAERVRAVGTESIRDDAGLEHGMDVVCQCDVLLVVWDGEPAAPGDPIRELVGFARELGRPLVILDPRTGVIRRERAEALAGPDAVLTELNALPSVDGPTDDTAEPERQRLEAFQLKVDAAAVRAAPHVRPLSFGTLAACALAGSLAAGALVFTGVRSTFFTLEAVALAAALLLAWWLRRQRSRSTWARYRLAAELARSALATWGLPRAVRLFEDIDWPGLEALRRTLDVRQRRSARRAPAGFDDFRQRYLRDRIDSQLAYFATQESRALSRLRLLRAGFVIAVLVGLGGEVTQALVRGDAGALATTAGVATFLALVAPWIAAGCIALISVQELHRRVGACRRVRAQLELVRREFVLLHTWGGLERSVSRTERVLLDEAFEWHAAASAGASGESGFRFGSAER